MEEFRVYLEFHRSRQACGHGSIFVENVSYNNKFSLLIVKRLITQMYQQGL